MKAKCNVRIEGLRRRPSGWSALATGLALALATSSYAIPGTGPVPVFTLHLFGTVTNDGLQPAAGMIQGVDSNFYGTASQGGISNAGTIFALGRNHGYTNLYAFTGGADGANPMGSLVQGTNGYLFGTTAAGGANGSGVIFRLSATGVFSNIHSFAGSDGAEPLTGLAWFTTVSNSVLLGTTYAGGASNLGTLFQISPTGVFTTLHSFAGSAAGEGANPYGNLTVGKDGMVFGTTFNGGASNAGIVFAYSMLTGIGTNLYSFTGGNDGAHPRGQLVQDDNREILGTTMFGGTNGFGTNGFGTVFKFKVIPSGLGTNWVFTNLYSFSGAFLDGGYPEGGLVKGHDGHFYGTTSGTGAVSNNGTIFKVSVGGRFFTLHRFAGVDGAKPVVRLAKGWDGFLYGTTMNGGTNLEGTIFRTPCPVPRLVFRDHDGQLASWIMSCTGTFVNAVLHGTVGGWDLRCMGDIDGDGVADWVFQDATGQVAVWFMNPDGTVRNTQFVGDTANWQINSCADVDGTGHAQYFFQAPDGQVAEWEVDTNGLYLSNVPITPGSPSWHLKCAVDLTAEGKAHLIWQRADGMTYAWIHTPNGALVVTPVLLASAGGWGLSGGGDIEGEGMPDLVWQDSGGKIACWFMDTNVTVRASSYLGNVGGWKLKGVAR